MVVSLWWWWKSLHCIDQMRFSISTMQGFIFLILILLDSKFQDTHRPNSVWKHKMGEEVKKHLIKLTISVLGISCKPFIHHQKRTPIAPEKISLHKKISITNFDMLVRKKSPTQCLIHDCYNIILKYCALNVEKDIIFHLKMCASVYHFPVNCIFELPFTVTRRAIIALSARCGVHFPF